MVIQNEIVQLKKFFLDNFNALVRFTSTYIQDRQEAEDIAQETFLRLYEKWHTLSTDSEIRSYMYITSHNLCISHLRHQSVEENYIQEIKERNQKENFEYYNEITYQEILRLLKNAINNLPPQSRRIILLSLDGKNNNEIAYILNISVNTVKTLKKNAYKTLRNTLGNLPEDYILFLLLFLKDI